MRQLWTARGTRPSSKDKKLEDLVVNGGADTADEDVNKHDAGGEQDADVEGQSGDDGQDLRHGIQADAPEEQHGDGENAGIEQAEARSVTRLQILRDAADVAAAVHRHHEEGEEDDGGDGADPVEVEGCNPVLRGHGA